MSKSRLAFRRVLLKLSGESLATKSGFGIDTESLEEVVGEIATLCERGLDVAVVVGGGNIVRGERTSSKTKIERVTADCMGMMGTVINALALRSALNSHGIDARVMSALSLVAMCELYNRDQALAHLEKKRVLILACGTGNPYFTTDTAAALRASELNCDVLVKATTVEGIYDSDPKQNADSQIVKEISYHDVLADDLRIMDHAAIALARDSDIPILVCSFSKPRAVLEALSGEGTFSVIRSPNLSKPIEQST
ncbi:MAG: UMP kinase [Pseudomonadota bacterium]